jgi:preprotein translocase SecE subunit
VARETRRQRRDARREAGDQDGATRSTRRGEPAPAASSAGGFGSSSGGSLAAPAPSLAPAGKRRFSFLREVIGELHKVEWPNRAQVIQGTVVVIVACAIVGTFLWLADLALKPFVQHLLLGQ